MYNLTILEEGCQRLGISLDEEKKQQFIKFYELLTEWNKVMNLTGITEFEEVLQKHFIDSLAIQKVTDMGETDTVIDVGTGAGFPGIPLKIAFPHLKITLLDSLQKRIRFLDEVVQTLNLRGVTTIHGRAEEYARRKEHREKYQICVSRAVANLSSLAEYCLPFVKKGGYFVSYKSGNIEEELSRSENAVKILGGEIENTVYFQLPGSDIERSFVLIKKKKNTPGKYPRKAGIPAKEPLN